MSWDLLALALNVVPSDTLENCDSGSVLSEMILVAALYFEELFGFAIECCTGVGAVKSHGISAGSG